LQLLEVFGGLIISGVLVWVGQEGHLAVSLLYFNLGGFLIYT
jgi:hypothetical protein